MNAPLLCCRGLEAGYGASRVLFGLDFDIRAGEVVALLGRNGMGKSTTIRSIVGGLLATDHVDLAVEAGEIHALIGPNGAGKSTLVNLISGLRPQRGEIVFDGRPIHAERADAIARLGVAIVPEGRQCFPNLTVHEHLVAFAACRNGVAEPWTPARLYALFPRLAERAGHLGNQLSGGEQQMLAIARALSTNPRLLILDEATEGISPLIRKEIWRVLGQLKQAGQAILVIDKYLAELMRVADRHAFIEKGRSPWSGDNAALAAEPELWERYLGV